MAKMVIKMISETEAQVTKAFAKNAVIFGTEEYKLWREYRKDFPDAKMVTKTIKKNPEKKTYRMDTIEAQSKSQKSPYNFVYNWFIAQFPNYNKIPTLKNGKLIYEDKRAKKPEAKIIPLSTDVA